MSKRQQDERAKKFVEAVHADLKALSSETRRKFHPVKEVWSSQRDVIMHSVDYRALDYGRALTLRYNEAGQ